MARFMLVVDASTAVPHKDSIVVGGAVISGETPQVGSSVEVLRAGKPPTTAVVKGIRRDVLRQRVDLLLDGLAEEQVPEGSRVVSNLA